MKVTVVGAGSTYTPELVEGLLARGDALPVTELVLHDVDAARLDVLTGLSGRMVAAAGSTMRVTVPTIS